jgi:hypothetical protein
MNRPTRYERAPLDVVVAEKERRRRRQDGDSRLPLPLYDTALPVPETPGRPVERPHAIVIDF